MARGPARSAMARRASGIHSGGTRISVHGDEMAHDARRDDQSGHGEQSPRHQVVAEATTTMPRCPAIRSLRARTRGSRPYLWLRAESVWVPGSRILSSARGSRKSRRCACELRTRMRSVGGGGDRDDKRDPLVSHWMCMRVRSQMILGRPSVVEVGRRIGPSLVFLLYSFSCFLIPNFYFQIPTWFWISNSIRCTY